MTEMNLVERNEKAVALVQNMVSECASNLLELGIPVQMERVSCIHLMPLEDTFAGCFFRRSCGEMEFVLVVHSDFVRYMDDPVVVENVRNSIYHELIHTCLNAQEHNDIWMYWSEKCDEHLGASTRAYLEYDLYYHIYRGEEHYVYRCDDCGFEYHSVDGNFEDMQCDICGADMYVLRETF